SVSHFATRDAALNAERSLIAQHRPPFNKQHNPNHEMMKVAYRALIQSDHEPVDGNRLLGRLKHRLPLAGHYDPHGREARFYTRPEHLSVSQYLAFRPRRFAYHR